MRISLRGLAVLASVSLMLSSAAGDANWTNPAGGVWSAGGNWSGSEVPGALDAALFNLSQSPAYTVDFSAAETFAGRLQVLDDEVVLDLGGNDLSLNLDWTGDTAFSNDEFDSVSPLMIARGTSTESHTGSLVIQGGGTVTGNGLLIGGTTASTGALTVQGVGTALQVKNTTLLEALVGGRGSGELQILGGATASFDYAFAMGRRGSAAADTRLVVDGAVQVGETLHRSTLDWGTAQGALFGHLNEAEIVIRNGALATGGGISVLAAGTRGATLTIDNAEFHQTSSQLRLSGGAATTTTDVINGGVLRVDAILQVAWAENSTAHLNVTDGQSRLQTAGQHAYFGGSTTGERGVAHVTFADGGSGDFGRMLRMYGTANLYLDDGTVRASDFEALEGASLTLTLHTGEFGPAIDVLDRAGGSGNADLGSMGFTLELAPGFSAEMDEVFTVLRYEGERTGTFFGLTEGATLSADVYEFELTYGTGTDSAVTLTVTAIPEPGSLVLVALAGGLLLLRRRKRA